MLALEAAIEHDFDDFLDPRELSIGQGIFLLPFENVSFRFFGLKSVFFSAVHRQSENRRRPGRDIRSYRLCSAN